MDRSRGIEIYRDTGCKLIAVQTADLQRGANDNGYYLHGTMKPVAVIVCSRDGMCALDMNAEPVALERLLHDVPGLDSLIQE